VKPTQVRFRDTMFFAVYRKRRVITQTGVLMELLYKIEFALTNTVELVLGT
jgi:hypothetical protein